MRNVFLFLILALLISCSLSSCAKYDYHSKLEITNEDVLDYHLDNLE